MDSKQTAWGWKSLQDEGQSEGQGAGNSGRERRPPDTAWGAEDWGNRGMGGCVLLGGRVGWRRHGWWPVSGEGLEADTDVYSMGSSRPVTQMGPGLRDRESIWVPAAQRERGGG